MNVQVLVPPFMHLGHRRQLYVKPRRFSVNPFADLTHFLPKLMRLVELFGAYGKDDAGNFFPVASRI
jgi:hypothetical protein